MSDHDIISSKVEGTTAEGENNAPQREIMRHSHFVPKILKMGARKLEYPIRHQSEEVFDVQHNFMILAVPPDQERYRGSGTLVDQIFELVEGGDILSICLEQ